MTDDSGDQSASAPVDAWTKPTSIPASSLPQAAFRTDRMVRFSDCDPAGIVYTARFVDMLNGVIEDLFPAALGLDYHGFIRAGLGLGYASLHCDFFRPASMGEHLAFTPLVTRIGASSARFVVYGHHDEDEVLRGHLAMVTTLRATSRPTPLPDSLRDALARYQEQCR